MSMTTQESPVAAHSGESDSVAGDTKKLQFMIDAFEKDPVGISNKELCSDIVNAVKWRAGKSCAQARAERESMIVGIEQRAQRFWDEGLVKHWFRDADVHIRKISANVNGPALEHFAKLCCYPDAECVDLFRTGAVIYDDAPAASQGTSVPVADRLEKLRGNGSAWNTKLLGRVSPDLLL